MIDQNQYLKDRIDDQIAWYGKRSRENKQWYTRLRILSIVVSLSIPVLAGSIGDEQSHEFKIIISIAGALVAFIEGLMSLKKYHELWTEYRATAEGLKYHRYLFEAGAAPYDTAEAFRLFVLNVEGIMATERTKWIQVASRQSPPPKAADSPRNEAPSGSDDTKQAAQADSPQPDAGTTNASLTVDPDAPAQPVVGSEAPESEEHGDDDDKDEPNVPS